MKLFKRVFLFTCCLSVSCFLFVGPSYSGLLDGLGDALKKALPKQQSETKDKKSSEKQIPSEPVQFPTEPFTFLGIGVDDDYTSAINKIKQSNKFEIIAEVDATNSASICFNDETTRENFKGSEKISQIRELYLSTMPAIKIKNMSTRVVLRPLDKDSMYLEGYKTYVNRRYQPFYSNMVFSGYNKKIIRLTILIKTEFVENVVENLTKKYGKPMYNYGLEGWKWKYGKRGSFKEKSIILGYGWESENDFMFIAPSSVSCYYYDKDAQPPDFSTEINIYFGKNVREWRDETLARLNKLRGEAQAEEKKKVEKAVSEF